MLSDEKSGRIVLKGALSKLPRISITPRSPRNELEGQSQYLAFGVSSAEEISNAFDIKRHMVK